MTTTSTTTGTTTTTTAATTTGGAPVRRRALRTGTALLLALAGAAGPAAAAHAAPGFEFGTRIAGADRFGTAVAASKLLHPVDGSAPDAVVVNATATVDGLTASYLSGLKSAPVLYTTTDAMPAASRAELERLGTEHVWIVGGPAVVSAAQERSWRDAGLEVTRLAGADRYATAAAVALVDGEYAPERVLIASGEATADALAVGPIAWARNYPILLTGADGVPAATRAALDALGTPDRTVVGGTARVSEATYAALGATQRIAGASRQETAALVAQEAITAEGFDPGSIALVGGTDATAADALAAAPVAGATGTPLLFTGGDGTLGTSTAEYLRGNAARFTGRGWVFGGPASVPQAAVDAARAAVQ